MKPVTLHAAEEGELPPLRWRTFSIRFRLPGWQWGLGLCVKNGEGEWALQLYLGRWIVGIERTREED